MAIVFDDEQPAKIVFDDEPKSLRGFGKNLLTDAASNIKGAAALASTVEPTMAVMQGQNPFSPKKPMELAKNLYEGVKNFPSQIGQEIMHPIDSMYKRPISTGMDVATVADLGATGARALIPNAERSAQNMALKSFGDTKRFVNNPLKEATARQSVQTLMDQGVLKPFSSVEGLADRTKAFADKSGQAIGKHLEKIGQSDTFFDPQQAVSEIEQLRPKSSNGTPLKGGAWDRINSRIDNAIATIEAYNPKEKTTSPKPVNLSGTKVVEPVDTLVGNQEMVPTKSTAMVGGSKDINWTGQQPSQKISWTDANKLKGALQDLADWKSNKEATVLDRVIAGKFRSVLDKSLENVSMQMGDAGGHMDFLKNKKVYSAAMNQMDPLYNRLSSELGNKGISLTDWILAAGSMGHGNPLTAVATVLAKKGSERFGPQLGAYLLNKTSKIKPSSLLKAGSVGLALSSERNK